MSGKSPSPTPKPSPAPRRTELLAPAGGPEAMTAAAAAGADAVYFGLRRFSARGRAENFSAEGLAATVAGLHARNVRAYVTVNTLVLDGELSDAADLLGAVASSGADAVIVQDLGLARLARELCPDLALHLSTQATFTDARSLALAARLGAERVILPREFTLEQVRELARTSPVGLEVFVHGALCISYSGQCLASASFGGRSANRGWCAQACRLPYAPIVDGRGGDSRRSYPLSPRDLAAWEHIPGLVRAGVAGLKIEGRLKPARYVAAATAFYRRALDAALAGRDFRPSPAQVEELALGFSRGFTSGFLGGRDHRALVEGGRPSPRGVRVGTVAGRLHGGVLVAVEAEIRPGDGLRFEPLRPGESEQGGRVYEVRPAGPGRVELRFGRGEVEYGAVGEGAAVWKTDDPRVNRRLDAAAASPGPVRREEISCRVRAATGQPLELAFLDGSGREARVRGAEPLQPARKHPATLETLREQLGRLGDTPFALGRIEAERLDPVMIPKSVLNDLRRQAVAGLLSARRPEARECAPGQILGALLDRTRPPQPPEGPARPRLDVLVRTAEQLDFLRHWRPDHPTVELGTVWCDLPDRAAWPGAVRSLRSAGASPGLVTPRVTEPGEEGLLEALAGCRPDAALVRSVAALEFFRARPEGPDRPELVGDFSLNVANRLTAALLFELGLARLTAACELASGEVMALAGSLGPARLETIVYRHVPMFHTAHCLYAAELGGGRSCADCPAPCRTRRLALRDRVGIAHPVQIDAARRCTVYGGTPQSEAQAVPGMLARGLRHFRLELLDETPARTAMLLGNLARLLAGELPGADFTRAAGARPRPALVDGAASGEQPKAGRPRRD